MMARSSFRTLALGVASSLISVFATLAQQPAAKLTARFDWFAYSGHDSVYDRFVAGPRQYSNPILEGFYPDPSIVRKGDDYYLVNSSFSYFPGVPIFHSKDLVDWTQIGSVLDRPSQLAVDTAGISRGVFAPSIREHDGVFYMITTVADAGNFIVTTKNPGGPWSDPIWLPDLRGAIDPSLFFDDDGKAYIVNNGPPAGTPLYDGHRAIWIQEYDIAKQTTIGTRTLIVNGGVDITKKPIWIEGPHIFKHGGAYYLICAEGGTAEQHSEVVFRAGSPRGPYTPAPAGTVNPILTQRQLDPSRPFPITSTGHADFVQMPNGDWWAVFLGVRPYANNLYNTGRETFLLPVHWENGWPIISSDGAMVPYVHDRPALPPQTKPSIPTSGNFTVRDDFDEKRLAPYWSFIRTVRAPFYDLSSHPGWLTLDALPDALGAHAHLSFVGRRQQHIDATVSTSMVFEPRSPADAAGLVALQTDDFYYFLGVTRANGRRVVALIERDGRLGNVPPMVVVSAPLSSAASSPVYLRIVARGGIYGFSYATKPNEWIVLKTDADGTILSSKVAGGFSSNFVGVMFGMYATSGAR